MSLANSKSSSHQQHPPLCGDHFPRGKEKPTNVYLGVYKDSYPGSPRLPRLPNPNEAAITQLSVPKLITSMVKRPLTWETPLFQVEVTLGNNRRFQVPDPYRNQKR